MRCRSWRSAVVAAAVALQTITATAPAAADPPFTPEALAVRQCERHPDRTADPDTPPPAELVAAIDDHLDDPRLEDAGLGLVVWIEGYTEVVAQFPDLRLRPASNQKLLTAMAAFETLGSDYRFTTKLATDGLLANGVLDGDLYLIGGGDATLASTGDHSLEALATAVVAAGIQGIRGSIVGDESRYDTLREANGWLPLNIPSSIGSLSALSVDQNRWRADWPFIADPALGNAELFAETLTAAGVVVDEDATVGRAPEDAVVIATLESAPLSELMAFMLTESNNMVAELTIKELGLVVSGHGTTINGIEVLADVVAALCVRQSTIQHDGSGLSHANARSPRSWVELLQSAQTRDWWDDLYAGLPIAGVSGTLQRRFLDTAAEDNLRAKTGSINQLRALSGMMTTAGGRRVFFSAIVDAPNPRPGIAAVDDLLVTIAEDGS